jgi:hypothetical protein
VQIVLKWPCSRKALWGRRTTTEEALASPALGRKEALRAGNLPRLVPPLSEREKFGLKPSLPQSVAAKEEMAVAVLPRFEVRLATVCFLAQEVGFKVKRGLSS